MRNRDCLELSPNPTERIALGTFAHCQELDNGVPFAPRSHDGSMPAFF
jgi:hypothetical protein